MALLALAQAPLAVVTDHAGRDINPLVSFFVPEKLTGSLVTIPFQPFGSGALLILRLMAATSQDFWLANLIAPVWTALHIPTRARAGSPEGDGIWRDCIRRISCRWRQGSATTR